MLLMCSQPLLKMRAGQESRASGPPVSPLMPVPDGLLSSDMMLYLLLPFFILLGDLLECLSCTSHEEPGE